MPAGLGFDIHALVRNRPLRIGGVSIPHRLGFEGHSDGDVVLHALVDALLGASGGGDIGERFPDTDPKWKGADSALFVREVLRDVRKRFSIDNVDVTVILERPKIGPHKARVRRRIADLLGVEPGRVNVKAKTMEGLGPIGEGRAGAAQVVATLTRKGRK